MISLQVRLSSWTTCKVGRRKDRRKCKYLQHCITASKRAWSDFSNQNLWLCMKQNLSTTIGHLTLSWDSVFWWIQIFYSNLGVISLAKRYGVLVLFFHNGSQRLIRLDYYLWYLLSLLQVWIQDFSKDGVPKLRTDIT